jgi:hypothetical protein
MSATGQMRRWNPAQTGICTATGRESDVLTLISREHVFDLGPGSDQFVAKGDYIVSGSEECDVIAVDPEVVRSGSGGVARRDICITVMPSAGDLIRSKLRNTIAWWKSLI